MKLAIPSPLHLIAMKLHALRNPARLESGIDLQDVKHLIKTARIDTSSEEFNELTLRYATPAVRTRLLRELGDNRLLENGDDLNLPAFASLPATSGLDNHEAFRLSLQHALRLLPALLARGLVNRAGFEHPDRFRIR